MVAVVMVGCGGGETQATTGGGGATTASGGAGGTGGSGGAGATGGSGGTGAGPTGEGTCASPIDITGVIEKSGKYAAKPQGEVAMGAPGNCAPPSGPGAVLQWNVPEAGNYRVTVLSPNGDVADEPAATITVRTDCPAPESELACDYDLSHDVFFGLPGKATVFIVVAGAWYQDGYALSVEKEAPCSAPADCNDGLANLCSAGVCVQCDDAGDCGGKICEVDVGQCVPCTSNADCMGKPTGSFCTNVGTCFGCVADSECAGSAAGEVCVAALHSCGCETAADCPAAGAQCVGNACMMP